MSVSPSPVSSAAPAFPQRPRSHHPSSIMWSAAVSLPSSRCSYTRLPSRRIYFALLSSVVSPNPTQLQPRTDCPCTTQSSLARLALTHHNDEAAVQFQRSTWLAVHALLNSHTSDLYPSFPSRRRIFLFSTTVLQMRDSLASPSNPLTTTFVFK